MIDFIIRTFGSKTGKFCLGVLLTCVGGVLSDKISVAEAWTYAETAIIGILIRDRMPKDTTRP